MTDVTLEPSTDLSRLNDARIKVSAREAFLERLLPLHDEVTAAAVAVCAQSDSNLNLRKAAVSALGTAIETALGPALQALELVLADPEPEHRFLRREAAKALATLGTDEALAILVGAAREITDAQVLGSIGVAISSFGERADIQALLHAAKATDNERVRGELLTLVVRLGGTGADQQLIEFAQRDPNPAVRAAAVRGLGVLQPGSVLATLEEIGRGDESPKVRRRAVDALGELAQRITGKELERIVALLAELLLDSDPSLRNHVATTLPAIGTPAARVTAVLQHVRGKALGRGSIDAVEIVAALVGRQPTDDARAAICDSIVQAAKDADDETMGVLAALLIAAHGGDVDSAGHNVNDIAGRIAVPADALERLRIAVGGETALDPVLAALRNNLQKHFHTPIEELNRRTQDAWLQTMDSAKRGFSTRILMSQIVFGVGLALLVVSSLAFFLGGISGGALFGVGASFASGLGVMLLVVYTGPLKDVRQSVSDLAASTAAYIAFVHRVLQVSHAFSESFLERELTPEKVAKLSKLIDGALVATVRSLQYERTSDSSS